MRIAVLATGLLWAGPAAAVVYVDAGASGSNNGSSWADAYADLGAALVATMADEIWVAAGVYTPAGPAGDRTATYALKDGVELYGGFIGGETQRDQRDPAANATVLNGDLNFDDYADSVNAHRVYRNAGDNSHHVVTASNVGSSAVLDGFVIEHGYARPVGFEGPAVQGGGALFIHNASPVIANTTIIGSAAQFGGAVYIYDSSPMFTDCELIDNSTDIGRGGAVYSGGASLPIFQRCIFSGNAAIGSSLDPDGNGGAIYNDFGSDLTILNSIFVDNLTAYRRLTTGGTPTTAGAIMAGGPVTIENSIFLRNTAHNGGALYAYNDATIINTLFSGNKAPAAPSSNSLPSGGYGGAMVLGGPSTLVGITVAGNTATENGGGLFIAGDTVLLHNSIVWGNVSTKSIEPGEDIIPILKQQISQSGGSIDFRYCDVQGLLETIPGEDPPNPNSFPGCIDLDPLFVDADGADAVKGTVDDNLRLLAGSPAIDAGSNSLIQAGIATDLDGNARREDDPLTADTGSGSAPIVDMGAYEFGAPMVTTTTTSTTTTIPLDSNCGDPVPDQEAMLAANAERIITATDALAVLRAAVDLFTCASCVCDVDNSGSVAATDALIVLVLAVGGGGELNCPACEE